MKERQAIAVNRFGLGARPGDRIGDDVRDWLLAQIPAFQPAPAPIAMLPSRPALRELGEFRALQAASRQGRLETMKEATPDVALPAPDAELSQLTLARKDLRSGYNSAATARLRSALQSDTPFVERLVHFWSNHFAVSADRLVVASLAGNYEFEAIRPHVLGNFADLLAAAVTHPAMMLYLDQTQSIGPHSEIASRLGRRTGTSGRRPGLNENLAREILELHTLGVRTGYSQEDVSEFARALTGWTVSGLGRGPAARVTSVDQPGEAVFVEAMHEPGARHVMGRRYAEGGAAQSRAVLGDLAISPRTARHLATKLARHFIADDPPRSAIERIERAFLAGLGDLPTVYRALVAAPEGWGETNAKFRSPWDWIVAALRASGEAEWPDPHSAAGMLQQLGQPIWRPGSPAGWGDATADWAGPGALLARVELSQQIAARVGNRIDPRVLAETVLGAGDAQDTAWAVARAEQPALGLALLLASPGFLRR